MREITLTEFITDYENGLISEVVYVGGAQNRVFGRSVKGMAEKPGRYDVVWAKVP